ncbi:putative F-box domain, galactose oxidase/kelch, beta-propeller, F-box associated interaction [Medicago truncatula]|uniref:F-box protein interaction domain protein n=1 Tax=Medicago truncatula TaxID=3880 RepID=G7IWQ6_MEDTR|nr:F-box/kelch-repeat protein At3g23880 [Medicago truncatula]AES69469.1 F-box protein interaction domain protein [Medicago truncatula]RHN66257.1 putative F-box domain, galactose oxidase/kelch, beta-propeller, F-box associated interaction [Medicago truncatula]
MAQGNKVLSSQSLTPELPTLPFDLIAEILCRLPVKFLFQLRCVCKFFHSLISDPKFAKNHLQLSTKRHHLMIASMNNLADLVLYDSPIHSVFSTSTIVTQTQLYPPNTLTNGSKYVDVLCSCDGIFCCFLKPGSYVLWNPSIRKFKLLPPLEIRRRHDTFFISFGYDHFIDKYKVIDFASKNDVFVYTLGTDYWTRIEDIPHDYRIYGRGVFVSGTVNWYAEGESDDYLHFILSLALEDESYRQLFLPDSDNESYSWRLDVLRDCLCVFETSDMFLNVWIMNKYGNEESWTKLFHVPNMQDLHGFEDNCWWWSLGLYLSEDDRLLMEFNDFESYDRKLAVYDSKTVTFNILEFQNNCAQKHPIVYIESLISP